MAVKGPPRALNCEHQMPPAAKYIAKVHHVREVSINGSADLGYWRRTLDPRGLQPVERNGAAQILIVAASMKFLGLPFTEVSFSVRVSGEPYNLPPDAVFLLHAFNSSRMLAWCERAFFSTPYHHARCRLSVALPSIEIDEGDSAIFRAIRQSEVDPAAAASPLEAGGWEGPIFLPAGAAGKSKRPKYFFGLLQGATRVFPFAPEDEFTIGSQQANPALQPLLDSDFRPLEWSVREDAVHARSKTYKVARILHA